MSHSTVSNAHPDQTATLFVAASETDSNLYYATRFIAPDPFIYLEVKGERLMVMSDLEVDRARHQATVDRVLSYSDLERRAKAQGVQDPGTIE
nr:aminopeptidase P family protein [Nitrospira sp.]